MSSDSVRAWLAEHAPDVRIIDAHDSTATVADAAATLGVEPARITKTLTVCAGDLTFLLCTRGDARLSNQKCKAELGARPKKRLRSPATRSAASAPSAWQHPSPSSSIFR